MREFMPVLREWLRRLRGTLLQNPRDRDLEEELRLHLELAREEMQRHGGSPADAARAASLRVGGLAQAMEALRYQRGLPWLDDLARDVRHGLRTLRRSPAFTTAAVLTLALGIGANTAIFSLIDALMLRWLPVRSPQELVLLKMHLPDSSGSAGDTSFSYAIVRALADQHEIFDNVAGFSGYNFNAGFGNSIRRVHGAIVTGGYYATFGLNPALGRLIRPEDDEPGAPAVAVIGFGYWERQFLKDPGTIGQTLLLNGVPVPIIGVSPAGFVGTNVGSIADVTVPVAALPRIDPQGAALLGPGNFWLRALARPAPRVSVSQAEIRLSAVWTQIWDSVIATHWPASRREVFAGATFELSPGGTGWTFIREIYRRPLLVLMAVVALVLLIACANVASLMLARASARQREIAVRLAVGAGRGRILRQLLTESILLSLVGAVIGIVLAWASTRLVVNLISTGPLQVTFDLTPNWRVFTFTGAIAVATALLFGLMPALQALAVRPSSSWKEDARMSRSRSLSALIAAQVALSLVLLVGAGLFARTLRNLQALDPGFNREGVLIVDMESRRTAVPAHLLNEIRRVPGVISASVSTHTPLSGSVWSEPAVPKGQRLPDDRDTAHFVGAGPGFFETMQTTLLAGREFTDRDSTDAPPVAVINEEFARRYFPKQNPLGQQLSAVVRGERRDLEIIGLARNMSTAGLRNAPPPSVYVSYLQLTGDFPTSLEVRAHGSLPQIAAALRQAIQPELPGATLEVVPLSAQVNASIVQERLMATLAGAFGILALVLSCIGLYGLLAYSVVSRTKEIGIRMAMGAHRTRVLATVLTGALRPVAVGVGLGLPAAWIASRSVQSMLFGLQPEDAATIAAAILVLTLAALVAAYLPASRASRIDPITALRHE